MLHVPREQIEEHRTDLRRGIDRRRTGKGTHQRVLLHCAVSYGLPSGVGVERSGSMFDKRQSEPLLARRAFNRAFDSIFPRGAGIRNVDCRKRLTVLRGRE